MNVEIGTEAALFPEKEYIRIAVAVQVYHAARSYQNIYYIKIKSSNKSLFKICRFVMCGVLKLYKHCYANKIFITCASKNCFASYNRRKKLYFLFSHKYKCLFVIIINSRLNDDRWRSSLHTGVCVYWTTLQKVKTFWF